MISDHINTSVFVSHHIWTGEGRHSNGKGRKTKIRCLILYIISWLCTCIKIHFIIYWGTSRADMNMWRVTKLVRSPSHIDHRCTLHTLVIYVLTKPRQTVCCKLQVYLIIAFLDAYLSASSVEANASIFWKSSCFLIEDLYEFDDPSKDANRPYWHHHSFASEQKYLSICLNNTWLILWLNNWIRVR